MTFLARLIDARRRANRLEEEVRLFPESDLSGLGLSRDDLRRIMQMPEEQIIRMHAMADRLGSWQSVLASPEFRVDVARRCAHCDAQDECRHALAAEAPEAALDFCPNAETFRSLARA